MYKKNVVIVGALVDFRSCKWVFIYIVISGHRDESLPPGESTNFSESRTTAGWIGPSVRIRNDALEDLDSTRLLNKKSL